MNYWDVEQPQFQIEQGTEMADDRRSDRPSCPASRIAPGRAEVVVAVKLQRCTAASIRRSCNGASKRSPNRVETVGTAKQAFVIETR